MRRAVLVVAICAALAAIWPGGAAAATNGPIYFTDSSAIWKINANGTGAARVLNKPAWSIAVAPDGKRMAFTHDGLFLTTTHGGKVKNLLKRYPTENHFAGVNWAQWAPNGKKIVFAGENDGRIYTIKPNGKGLKYLLGKNRVGVRHPVYSPNGREIAFLDTYAGSSLLAVDLATHKERMIYSGSGPAGTPSDFDWHPSGSRIAFYAPYRNWMINSDGTGLRQISPDSAFVSYENMTFSPDGTGLVGRSVAEGGSTSELWLMDGNLGAGPGGFTQQITASFPGSAFTPDWAPAPKG